MVETRTSNAIMPVRLRFASLGKGFITGAAVV
jgi:hypothetical protein